MPKIFQTYTNTRSPPLHDWVFILLHDSCACSETKPGVLLAWISQDINKLQFQSVSISRSAEPDSQEGWTQIVTDLQKKKQHKVEGGGEKTASWEVEEVLYTRASGMVKSRSIQIHRATDLAPPAGSVSSVSVSGHFRRPNDKSPKGSAPNHHSTWAFSSDYRFEPSLMFVTFSWAWNEIKKQAQHSDIFNYAGGRENWCEVFHWLIIVPVVKHWL